MPWVLLALGIASLVGAVAVVARGSSGRRWSVPHFIVGWLVGELAPHVVAAQAILALLLVAAGALDELAGKVGLALLGASWLAMALAQSRAAAAEPVLRRTLREDLGLADDSPGELGSVRSYVPYIELLNPFRMRREDVEILLDVPCLAAGRQLRLELYRPRRRSRPLPVLLQIQGSEKCEEAQPLMNLLASKGWACIAVHCLLGAGIPLADGVADANYAIAWIRRHGPEYGLDPSFVAIAGCSAGADLSCQAALTAAEPGFPPGFEDIDTSVSACISSYGTYDFRGSDSPVLHVRDGAPPFFVLHGTHDSMAKFENARTFVDELRRASKQPVLYAELPGAQHGFDLFHSLRTGHTINAVHRFLEYTYARFRLERGGDAA